MEKDPFVKIIIKYSILLLILQILQYAWFHLHYMIGGESMMQYSFLDERAWIIIETIARKTIFLLFAILIYFDLRKNNNRNFVLPIITFLFGYFGIYISLIFLTYIIHKNKIKQQTTVHNSLEG